MSKQLYMYELGVVPEDEGKSGMDVVAANASATCKYADLDVVAANASDACKYAEQQKYKVVSLNEGQPVKAIVEDKS